MKMQKAALLATIALAPACGKKDGGGDSGPSRPETPELGSVAPASFRNTATSAREVADRVGEVGQGLEKGDMGLAGIPRSRSNRLSGFKSAFLKGAGANSLMRSLQGEIDFGDEATRDQGPALADGADCNDIVRSIGESYDSAVKGLRSSADALVTFDEKLPEGVTKLPANEKFAVSYQVDLGRVATTLINEQREPGSPAVGDTGIKGNALIAAGANDHAVGIEASIDGALAAEGNDARLQAGFAAYADGTEQLIKLRSNLAVSSRLTDRSGPQAQTVANDAKASFGMNLKGGALPAIEWNGAVSGNVTGEDGKQRPMSATGAITLAKKSADQLELRFTAIVDGKQEGSAVTLVSDGSGRCVVRNQVN